RVLDPPAMMINNTNIITEKGEWETIKFNKGADLYNWSVVCFDPELNESVIEPAFRQLKEILISKGLNVPHMPKILRRNCHDYENSITKAAQDAIIDNSKPAQLVICIIPRKHQEEDGLYANIKRLCYIKLGIMNQCILKKNIVDMRTQRLVNNIKSVLSNVALKINGKLDGKNSRLADNLLDFKAEKDHMVFAADVYHPGSKDKIRGRPSVAAVCGSMDDNVTDYACRYRMNEKLRHDVDIIEKLNDMVIELLEQHTIKQTKLPDQIVFYRDGVGETQFDTVISEELEPLLDTLENHYKSKDLPTPKLTFIIIQKRHHARFKLINGENCKLGTIIDTDIVMKKEFSFYLQSHISPRGTARSAYYHVVLNQGNFSADEIYNLTFRLCFLSYRCNRALSQVTPASYAHNIANLARYFVEYKAIEENQENQGNRGGRGGRGGRGRGGRGRGGRGRGGRDRGGRGRGRGGRGGQGGQGNRENLEGNRDDRRNRDNNSRPPRPEFVQDGKTLVADSKIENEKFFL
ncbi:36683_t:CDS:2, partial [Racocetra persica]